MENAVDPVCLRVGMNIRRLRLVAGLSQGGFAERLGVTYQQVQKYEKGVNQVGAVTLYRLTQILDCDVAALFIGIGGDAANPLDSEIEYATLRWSRSVQSIGDRRVRQCLIDLCRELARRT